MFIFSDSSLCRTRHAARLVSRTRRHDHITPVLVSLHWLPVYKTSVLVWKCLHDAALAIWHSGWPVCAGPLRAWAPATAFNGIWDSASPARPDWYRSAQLRTMNHALTQRQLWLLLPLTCEFHTFCATHSWLSQRSLHADTVSSNHNLDLEIFWPWPWSPLASASKMLSSNTSLAKSKWSTAKTFY